MTPLVFAGIAVAGGVGAAVRLLVDGLVRTVVGGRLPSATIVINASGSLLLGLLTGLAAHGRLPATALALLGTGVIGGYTTFSTSAVETVRLLQEHRLAAAAVNTGGLLAVAVALAFGGYEIGLAL